MIQTILIFLGIPILLLPLFCTLSKKKKLTIWGGIFILICIAFAILEYLNVRKASNAEERLNDEKQTLNHRVDSLLDQTRNLSDTVYLFKSILSSLDYQSTITNEKLTSIRKANDSLNNKLIVSDRPVFTLSESKIIKSNFPDSLHSLEFTFTNSGIRSATNVFGKMYISFRDTTWDTGTISVSRSDVFPSKQGFVLHMPMKYRLQDATYQFPIFYYFKFTYSDIILDTIYTFESALKISPSILTELTMCKEWEVEKIRKAVNSK